MFWHIVVSAAKDITYICLGVYERPMQRKRNPLTSLNNKMNTHLIFALPEYRGVKSSDDYESCPISPILAPSLVYSLSSVSIALHTGHVMRFCSSGNTAHVHSGSLRTVNETVREPLTTNHARMLQSQPVCFGNGGETPVS